MKINLSPKITIPLGILLLIIAGLTYNYLLATIGGILFLLGLHDYDSIYRKEQMKTPISAKIIFTVFLAIIALVFWYFFY